ncbi:MAG: ABC transporter substrate-binding protein [Chloroflexi bacterium]|nr:ABC transporter substrate-binding protein [Chloroflexota bacterium]
MSRTTPCLVVSCIMVLSLMIAACGPAVVEEKKQVPVVEEKKSVPVVEEKKPEVLEKEAAKPTAVAPKYGGVLTLSQAGDIGNFDSSQNTAGSGPTLNLSNQGLWAGDWAKGPAGGHGTNKTDWGDSYDLFGLKTGYLAEDTKWTADFEKNEGTIVYHIRQGVHWGLNRNLEASRLVGGRELTADDVISELKRATTWPKAYVYGTLPDLRNIPIAKTGPWEVTLKVPLNSLYAALARLGDALYLHPPEVVQKYGDASNWRNSVGTGPFMLIDWVPGSAAILTRNVNYWMKDPVGPGNGNQLPYLGGVRLLIIPDKSTEQAALRTAKIDRLTGITWEDAAQLRKTNPALLEAPGTIMSGIAPIYINTSRKPFTDVRVRRAMMMATDLEAIRKNVNGGLGQVLTTPYPLVRGYEALYLALDDPEMPVSVRELYIYNPDKAKQLLKEAGYPTGFKTSVLITAGDVDYYSIIRDMWSKVGIDLALDVRETAAATGRRAAGVRDYDMAPGPHAAVPTYYMGQWFGGGGLDAPHNYSQVNDTYINETIIAINQAIFKDGEAKAMAMTKDLMKYVLDQAYAIPRPRYNLFNMWWPWVKNYSGEHTVGYYNFIGWAQWVWIDQDLKKSMGY